MNAALAASCAAAVVGLWMGAKGFSNSTYGWAGLRYFLLAMFGFMLAGIGLTFILGWLAFTFKWLG